ncbi:MAG: signal peptidase I [Gammaproteobacteria bacterium]|nr:signal peptidase I [Gammaproteobacteria bacterium]
MAGWRSRITHALWQWRGVWLLIAILLVFRSAIADWNRVPSRSMTPSILAGDRIIVDKLAYGLRIPFTLRRLARWAEPARGDVVTFVSPLNGRLLVKRVIGLPGDWVALQDNVLSINGRTAAYRALAAAEADIEGSSPHIPQRYFRESILGASHRITLHPEGGSSSDRNLSPSAVPKEHYLLLGDNRDSSQDSRAIGFVEAKRILGRATAVAFSLDAGNCFKPRPQRFMAELD